MGGATMILLKGDGMADRTGFCLDSGLFAWIRA
jgi:hypothetical protein